MKRFNVLMNSKQSRQHLQRSNKMEQAIKEIVQEVKKEENYIPRNYQTIGGMWTVDTWKKDGVTVQVMDEGYTTKVFSDSFEVIIGYNGKEYVRFEKGSVNDLNECLSSMK